MTPRAELIFDYETAVPPAIGRRLALGEQVVVAHSLTGRSMGNIEWVGDGTAILLITNSTPGREMQAGHRLLFTWE